MELKAFEVLHSQENPQDLVAQSLAYLDSNKTELLSAIQETPVGYYMENANPVFDNKDYILQAKQLSGGILVQLYERQRSMNYQHIFYLALPWEIMESEHSVYLDGLTYKKLI